jgi:hypothetical protein
MISKGVAKLVYPTIPRPAIYCFVIALSLSYIIIVAHTPLAVYATATFDDTLFMALGQSLAEGRWLGVFSDHTLVKGPGYPAFLAVSHWLGTSVSLAHGSLHCAAIILFVYVVHRAHGSWLLSGLLFALLIWHPVTMTVYLLRVFRDEIYYSQVLIVLAMFIWTLFFARGMTQRAILAALTGLLLGWFWLTREEGAFTIPALILLVVVGGITAFKGRHMREFLAALLIVIASYAACELGFRGLNWVAYGAFIGVDIKEANFQRALGQLHSVRSGGVRPFVSITRAARERVYAVSPAFASLAGYLDGPPGSDWVDVTCKGNPTACGEIGSGWFLFALRRAAATNGHYATPAKASAFFGQLADEITAACANVRLECSPQLIAQMPPVSLHQIAEGFQLRILRIFDLLILPNPALHFNPSLGAEESLEAWLRFLNHPLYTASTETSRSPTTYSLFGWYYRFGDAWFDASVKGADGSSAEVQVDRRPSPDIQQAFKDPDASMQRFTIRTRCGDQCIIQFRAADGVAGKTLVEIQLAPTIFNLGAGRVYIDETRQIPANATLRSQEIANILRRAVATKYKLLLLPVLAAGTCAFLALTLFRLKMALSNLCYVLALTCWVVVVSRTGLLTLVDVTSFPALNAAYLTPAYFLLISGAVLSIGAWIQFFLYSRSSLSASNGIQPN